MSDARDIVIDYAITTAPGEPYYLHENYVRIDTGTFDEMKEAAREKVEACDFEVSLTVIEETMERTLIHDIC